MSESSTFICYHCNRKNDSSSVLCQNCYENGHRGMPFAGCLVCAKNDADKKASLKESTETVLRDLSLFVVVFCALFGRFCVQSSPIPKHKPLARPDLTSKVWIMRWRGGDYLTHFHKDGQYACCAISQRDDNERTEWQGPWHHDLKTDTLHVEDFKKWKVKLRAPRKEDNRTKTFWVGALIEENEGWSSTFFLREDTGASLSSPTPIFP